LAVNPITRKFDRIKAAALAWACPSTWERAPSALRGQDWRALSARIEETLHERINDLFALLDQFANDVGSQSQSS
jgi:hypothetical protein